MCVCVCVCMYVCVWVCVHVRMCECVCQFIVCEVHFALSSPAPSPLWLLNPFSPHPLLCTKSLLYIPVRCKFVGVCVCVPVCCVWVYVIHWCVRVRIYSYMCTGYCLLTSVHLEWHCVLFPCLLSVGHCRAGEVQNHQRNILQGGKRNCGRLWCHRRGTFPFVVLPMHRCALCISSLLRVCIQVKSWSGRGGGFWVSVGSSTNLEVATEWGYQEIERERCTCIYKSALTCQQWLCDSYYLVLPTPWPVPSLVVTQH